jgi:hypothetical protein
MLTVTQGVRTRRLATRETGILNGLPKQLHELADYSLPPLKDWEFPVDNLFAEHVFTAVGSETLLPAPEARQPGGSLCSRCIHLDFWVGGFSMIDDVTAIAAQAKKGCDFCALLAKVCKKSQSVIGGKFQIERKHSNLWITGDIAPALSIFRSPGQ